MLSIKESSRRTSNESTASLSIPTFLHNATPHPEVIQAVNMISRRPSTLDPVEKQRSQSLVNITKAPKLWEASDGNVLKDIAETSPLATVKNSLRRGSLPHERVRYETLLQNP